MTPESPSQPDAVSDVAPTPPTMAPGVERPDRVEPPGASLPSAKSETVLSAVFFALALIFLAELAGFSHRYGRSGVQSWEIRLMGSALAVVWPMFAFEAMVRWYLGWRRGQWLRGLVQALVVFFVPPLRLGFRGYYRQDQIWLPFLGWQNADKQLYRRLERFFSIPMVCLALLVLPILVCEYGWPEWRDQHAWFGLALDAASAVIWLAFAFEFIVLVSLSANRWQFCVRHWIELLIVLLPLVEVLPMLVTDLVPTMRLLRVLRLQQLGRFGRVYRLRALLTKLWRSFLVLEIIQRLTGQTPEKRLRRLRELLQAKLEEIEELKGEIAQLEAQVEKAHSAAEGTMRVKGQT
ncbi:MAG: hypothetical protein RMJ82_08475 [Gemmatales bacterium]|nr:hypothetical protein [Gemmatales bacterium]